MNAGIYTMSADAYHADPAPAPSLSSSVANLLLTSSPRHAWLAHPKLGNAPSEEEERFDLGTAAHAYVLEGISAFSVVDANDWRTKDAKEKRDAARAEGRVPLLARQWDAVQAMADALGEQCARFSEAPPIFAAGKPEQTLIWQDRGVWCRARLDWLHDDHRTIDDLKTVGGSANPDAWTRGPLFGLGADLQAAFYLRGLKALTGVDATFRFVVVENYAPYAMSVIALGPDVMDLAHRKVEKALALWRTCLETDRWPAYPTRICWASLPPWEETRWAERYEVVDDGRPISEQL